MRRVLSIMLVLLAGAACDEDASMPVAPETSEAGQAGFGMAGAATYRVTISNLTTGQPFTPPLAAVHRRPVHLFAAGQAASTGVQQIAENGNLAPMLEALAGNDHVKDVVVTEGPTLPPLLPGETVSFEISGQEGARYLSVISMLICTNDGFMGVDGWRLPQKVGDRVVDHAFSYDAGTEINTEDFTDLVPPCPALTGVPTTETGTGMSNPALAEGGTVQPHPGVQGVDDLDPALHGWTDPVARVEVERIG